MNRTKEEMDRDTQEAWKQYNSGAIKERTKDVVDEDNVREPDNTEPVSTETVSVTHSRCDRE